MARSTFRHTPQEGVVRDLVSMASRWIRAVTEEAGLAEADRFRVDLCVSELVNNAASYGVPALRSLDLVMEADWTESAFTLTLSDNGRPFDPVGRAPDRPTLTVEQASQGGHGLHLIRTFTDETAYVRRGDRNVVTLAFRRTGPRPPVARGIDRRRDIGRNEWADVSPERRSGRDRRALGFVSTSRLFRAVPYSVIEPVLTACRRRPCADGEVLVRPGEGNDRVGLVLRGRLRVHLESPGSDDFIEILPGECVGEMSVIDGKPVSAYVIAESGSELLLIEGRVFIERLLTVPQIARNLVSMLAERMRRSNRSYLGRLHATLELERIRREIDFAAEIQASMLPHRSPMFPDRRDIDCAAGMKPARDVGGDFFDAFLVGPHRLFFAVGDVCGKGLPAAMLMVRALTLVRAEAARRHWARPTTIGHIVELVNAQLTAGNDSGLFLSLFCGVLDLVDGTLTYVNAGHNPPIVKMPGQSGRFLSGPRNPVIGFVDDLRYEAGQLCIPPEGALIAYTDGVTEAENGAGAFFGEHRLMALADDASRGDAQSRLAGILGAVADFAGGREQADDITLLVLRRPGNPSAGRVP